MNVKEQFKKVFKEEFDDPNEAFQDFLLSLIPIKTLLNIMLKGNEAYYCRIDRYL